MCTCQVTFISTEKDSSVSIIIVPNMDYPVEHIVANRWNNTLSNCNTLWCISVCCLKRPFTFPLDAIIDHNQSSSSTTYDIWQSVAIWSHNHTLAYHFQASLTLPRNSYISVLSLVSISLFSHNWNFWSPYNSFTGSTGSR